MSMSVPEIGRVNSEKNLKNIISKKSQRTIYNITLEDKNHDTSKCLILDVQNYKLDRIEFQLTK